MKPAVPSCAKAWAPGRVTVIPSRHTVCVDGMPRHVRDVRKRRRPTMLDESRLIEDDELWPLPDHEIAPEGGGEDVPEAEENTDSGSASEEGEERISEGEENSVVPCSTDRDEGEVVREPQTDTPDGGEEPDSGLRRSCRIRRPPAWLSSYDP